MYRFSLVGGLLLAAHAAGAQRATPTPLSPQITPSQPAAVVVRGRVLDQATGQPVPGATVLFPDLRQGAATDSTGRFAFTRLPRGRFLVQVRSLGYATLVRPVDTDAAQELTVQLVPAATEIGQVVVTGTSAATEMRRSPVPTTSLDRTQLNQSAATNAIDALARVPGLNQLSTGPGISKPVVRGLGYNRLVTLNNGSKQEGQQWGDEHGIELDENSFDRVEIIKGPGSLLYGSDALAGVLNFLSPDPLPEGRVVATASANYQTNANLQAYSLMTAGNLSGVTWLARGSGKVAADYRNAADGRVFNSAFRELDGNGYLGLNRPWGFAHVVLSSFNQRLGIPEGDRDSLSGRFTRAVVLADSGATGGRPVTDAELRGYGIYTPSQRINHQRLGLDNNFILGQSRLTVQVNYQQSRRREFGEAASPAQPGLHLQLRTVDYAVRWFLAERNGWQPVVGLSGMRQWNANRGTEFLIPAYRLLDGGAFVTLHRAVGRLDLSGGARYDVRQLQADALFLDAAGIPVPAGDPTAEQQFAALDRSFRNATAAFGAALNLTDQLTLKANAARGFRAPNIAELTSNGAHEGTNRYELGGPALRSESSLQLDAGISYVTDHLSVTVDGFRNRIQRYIFPRRVPTAAGQDSLTAEGERVFAYAQGDARLFGGEATLDLHPHPLDWLHFESSFSLVRAEQLRAPAADQRWLPFTPADRLQSQVRGQFAQAGHHVANLYARLGVEYNLPQRRVFSAYGTETPTPAYLLVNAGVGADVVDRRRRTRCSLHVALTNVFDVTYQSHLSRLKYAAPNYATGRSGIFNPGRNLSIRLVVPLVLAGRG